VETDFGPIGYESSLEQGFLLMMIADPQTVDIEHQPVQINFRIPGKPRTRRYTPDYLVKRDLDKPWIWGSPKHSFRKDLLAEVKPRSKVTHGNQSAFERHTAGSRWAGTNGLVFKVVTESFITPICVNNSKNIVVAREGHFPAWIKCKPNLTEPVPIWEVFEACCESFDPKLVPHFLYFGMGRGWFWTRLNLSLSLTTIVYPS